MLLPKIFLCAMQIKTQFQYTANMYSHSTSLLQLKRCAITANGGVLILAVLHYSYSTPKSCTKDNNLDEQLIFIRITAIVSTMQNVHLCYD